MQCCAWKNSRRFWNTQSSLSDINNHNQVLDKVRCFPMLMFVNITWSSWPPSTYPCIFIRSVLFQSLFPPGRVRLQTGNVTLSCVPRGDTDPKRNQERSAATTNRFFFSEVSTSNLPTFQSLIDNTCMFVPHLNVYFCVYTGKPRRVPCSHGQP